MNEEPIIPLKTSIIISQKNGYPCLELRKTTIKTELIKNILFAAFKGVPIMIQPTFSDELKSRATLVEKGIIYKDKETDEYFFNI